MLNFVSKFNLIIFLLLTAAYAHQIFYAMVALLLKQIPLPETQNKHRYAVLIAARNESRVLGGLIDSIKNQNYPHALLDIFVVADNCTDNTALVARENGAIVYERFNATQIGKGYALDFLIKCLAGDFGWNAYEGYFVFDADNLLAPDYVTEMNKLFDSGYRIVTSYRNTKNYASNWISAGSSLWFMHESQYLNYPRMKLGTSCAISGTGFLIHSSIIRKNNGWKYHLLTEDIEFSVESVLNEEHIGYCHTAIFYDEQPCTWRQSWHQRLRWTKGFYQVLRRYYADLLYGMLKGHFACFDRLMTIVPALIISLACVFVNGLLFSGALLGAEFSPKLVSLTVQAMLLCSVSFYSVLFLLGLMTTVSEWSKIEARAYQKIMYLFTFPLFIFSYVPISIVALFKKIQWVPITHSIDSTTEEIAHQ